jgi:hypothetical protein
MSNSFFDQDFFAWAIKQARLLHAGKLSDADIEPIAEKIESMGKAEKRELLSRLFVLLAHLLKWQFLPGRRRSSWQVTIRNQRRALTRCLAGNPSLKSKIPEALSDAYGDTREAYAGTGLPVATRTKLRSKRSISPFGSSGFPAEKFLGTSAAIEFGRAEVRSSRDSMMRDVIRPSPAVFCISALWRTFAALLRACGGFTAANHSPDDGYGKTFQDFTDRRRSRPASSRVYRLLNQRWVRINVKPMKLANQKQQWQSVAAQRTEKVGQGDQ